MERNTVERVTEWGSEPFNGGYTGLHEFADRDFTGAVTDGAGWLFMLNGRVVGVFDDDLSRFSDADGTAYVAPDQSLPLLFTMQETGGEVRGEYYTEETPLSEVDRTLQSGNFTGYVELSENVLSGDYYLVYYGGRRLPVAFVGNQERRLTGDEAFERAADEVGIYRVKTVNLEITDIPEPAGADSTTAAAAASDSSAEETTATPDEPVATPDEPATTSTDTATGTETPSPTEATTATEEATPTATQPDPEEATPAEPVEAAKTTETDATEADSVPSESSTPDEPAPSTTQSTTESTTAEPTPATDAAASGGSEFAAEAEWQGTSTIPALDPEESVSMESETPPAEPAEAGGAAASTGAATGAGAGTAAAGVPPEEVEALRDERDRLRERVETLEGETERLGSERDRLERERDEAASTAEGLEDELEELRATVDRLEAELEAAESELAAAQEYIPEGDHEVSPEEAMQGTSLFVRYEREGGPTLEDAHNGDAGRDAVNGNVRLERHTEFEDEGALVDGEPFDEWLRDTIEYGFVNWLTGTFVHDIRETRNQTALGKLFDAIPEIDRIEFRGSVDLGEVAEDEEGAGTESAAFDVVLRDRMGQPLIVTDLNDSREPATEPMLESLIRNATPVGEASERLSAAFYVTSSYYEPGALETAEEATGGGILSRGKNKSFVRLSRTDGYHLAMVETRDGEFHVTVPEL